MEKQIEDIQKKLQSIEFDLDDLKKIIMQVGINMKTNFENLEKKIREQLEEIKK